MGIKSTNEVECVETENDFKKGLQLRTPNAFSDLDNCVCSASDGVFSVGDDVTSKVISSSDIMKRQITAFDLADVFLDPEVVDLIFKKLLRKFNISSPR